MEVTPLHRALCVALLALGLALPAAGEVNLRSDLDLGELAACVADSGAVYYGAHWCPVCKKQNAYFGMDADALPYVECYDGSKSAGRNDACTEADIRSFPTWVFRDGTRKSGAFDPARLAAATGCY